MARFPHGVLYHVTLARHLPSIRRVGGLDPSESRGRRKAVWLVSKHNVAWAVAHVMRRHGVAVGELVVLRVAVTSFECKRSSSRGVYYCERLVPVQFVMEAVQWLDKEERGLKAVRQDEEQGIE